MAKVNKNSELNQIRENRFPLLVRQIQRSISACFTVEQMHNVKNCWFRRIEREYRKDLDKSEVLDGLWLIWCNKMGKVRLMEIGSKILSSVNFTEQN